MAYELDHLGQSTVAGILTNEDQLEKIVTELNNAGFRNSDISVLMPKKSEAALSRDDVAFREKGTLIRQGAVTGGTSGLLIGGALGWLASAGTFLIPGIGPALVAGPLLAIFAGAGVGTLFGTAAGALVGIGVIQFDAEKYENLVKQGNIFLCIFVDNADWSVKARNILEDHGATDVIWTKEKDYEKVLLATHANHQVIGAETFSDLRAKGNLRNDVRFTPPL